MSGLAISTSGHTPGVCRTYKDQLMKRGTETWAFPQPEPNPYQTEWDDLATAIINNTPYNEVKRGVEASIASSMGRMAAHTGKEVTFDDHNQARLPMILLEIENGKPVIKGAYSAEIDYPK